MKFPNKKSLRKAGEGIIKLLQEKQKEFRKDTFERCLLTESDPEIMKMLDAIPKPKKKPKPKPETKIVGECLKLLKLRGIFAWRNNTGGVYTKSGGFYRFGMPGQADITGLLPDGRRLEVEVKRPGGKQTGIQKAFEKKIIASNGVYLLVYSASELNDKLVGL